MSKRTLVVGTRSFTLWILIVIVALLLAGLAVGGLVVLPQIQQNQARQARQAEAEQHYQAGVAFQKTGDWAAAEGEYKQVISIDANYKDVQARLAEVKARLAENQATATAVAIAQAEQAQAEAQATATTQAQATAEAQAHAKATATAQAEATATAKALAVTATAETLEAQYQRGLGYINLEKWVEAKAELERVFAADPNYKEVQAKLAEVEAKLEELNIPTATPTPEPTDTPLPGTPTPRVIPPTSTPTPYPERAVPTGDWAVRSYNTDDLGVIFVNDKMVGASTYKAHDNTGWIVINDLLVPGQDPVVAFASSNDGGSERRWGFSVRRNDVVLWGSEESPGRGPTTLSYVQQVSIRPDGSVEAVPPDTSARTPLPGKWYVRVQDVDDVGVILVNGVPVAAVHDRRDSGWVEITGQLYSDRDNAVTVAAWNFDAGYAWKFSIKRDETILWAVEKSGSGLTGLTLYQPVTISSRGELMAP